MKIFIMLLVAVASTALPQESAPYPTPPADITSVATLTDEREPGAPLMISGTVYRSDGTTPYPDLVLFFYQTGASGVYNKTDNNFRNPRLRGWVRTDDRGRYAIRTIRPGSYPGGRQPAHIHVTVRTTGSRARWLDDFLFSDDPNLSPSQRVLPETLGNFSHVLVLSKGADGMFIGRRDIVVAD
ncbi:MAG: protocatechuate 3,4-dioxygenase [Ignavibacterium sp.]|jgi:protocatechuate 3,4-dioxygenase beta subunit